MDGRQRLHLHPRRPRLERGATGTVSFSLTLLCFVGNYLITSRAYHLTAGLARCCYLTRLTRPSGRSVPSVRPTQRSVVTGTPWNLFGRSRRRNDQNKKKTNIDRPTCCPLLIFSLPIPRFVSDPFPIRFFFNRLTPKNRRHLINCLSVYGPSL